VRGFKRSTYSLSLSCSHWRGCPVLSWIYQQLMTVGTARNKIEAAEKLIAELQKQQGYLEIRLEQEKREIKALKHELEVMHIARDLPVPKVCAL
jgi:septal ring factor EnvC (AmiA/AmiB activator)